LGSIAIFAIGNMVYTTKQVVEKLKQNEINITLINIHTLKPSDKEIIQQVGSTHHSIFTVEEHYIHGGLDSTVAEVLIELLPL